MIKEIPRVMAIYDVDLPVKNARSAVAFQFRKNKNIEDSK